MDLKRTTALLLLILLISPLQSMALSSWNPLDDTPPWGPDPSPTFPIPSQDPMEVTFDDDSQDRMVVRTALAAVPVVLGGILAGAAVGVPTGILIKGLIDRSSSKPTR